MINENFADQPLKLMIVMNYYYFAYSSATSSFYLKGIRLCLK